MLLGLHRAHVCRLWVEATNIDGVLLSGSLELLSPTSDGDPLAEFPLMSGTDHI